MTRGDLMQFGKWLLERRLAPQHVITHMRRWVMRFIQLRATLPGETWQDTLTVYLEDLSSGQ